LSEFACSGGMKGGARATPPPAGSQEFAPSVILAIAELSVRISSAETSISLGAKFKTRFVRCQKIRMSDVPKLFQLTM